MKKFLKQFYGVILGIFLLGVVFGAPALKQWNNSKFELSQYRILFTDTGLPNGIPVMDINSGGNNISYGPLLDGEGNLFLTGYTETDPVFMANSGDYLPLAGNSELTAISGDVYFQPHRALERGEVGVLNGYINYSDVSKEISMNSYDLSTNKNGFVRIQDGYPEMGYSHNGSFRFVKLQTGGLVYQDDYSADYTDRSLVDKGYVDGELSGIETFWEFDGVTLNPTATGDVSLKIGLGSQVNTSNSASIGQYAYANGTGSYAFGNSAWALGEGSFAIGRQANANGLNAYSVGYNSKANQEDSYVFGVHSVANGFGSMTLGQYAKSNNVFSTAIGYSSQANADYSISAGNNTITNSVSSMAIGKYNVGNADSVFEVGFGANGTSRENLFEVKNNGNIYVSKLTGYTCLATDSVGMVYDNTGVFTNYVPRTAVDTGWNNTGSDTIIPSEKLVWSLVSGLNNDYIPYWDGSKFINSSILGSNNIVIGVDNSSSCIEITPTVYDCDIGQVCPDDASVCSCGASFDVYAGDVCTFHGAGTGSTTTIGSGLMFYSSDDFLVSALKYEFKISQNPIYDVAKFFQHKGYFGGVKKCMYNSGIDAHECDKGAICEETECICDTLLGFISYGEICSKTPDVDFSVINTGGSHVSISDGWVIFNGEWRLGMSGNNFVTQAFTGGAWVEKASLTND